MIRAFAAGLLAASALLVGASLALVHRVHDRTLGLIMAFGAGVLISAVAFDLVVEAIGPAGADEISIGMLAGAVVFFLGDLALASGGASRRKSPRGPDARASAKAIVLGTVLDGLPESIVIGVSLLGGQGVSIAFLIAVFLSNLPEAMSASTGLATSGTRPARIMLMWLVVVVVSGAAAAVGYGAFTNAAPGTVAFVKAFGGGAILTMLADTMMPEAFEQVGPATGLVTTIGFILAFVIATLEHQA
jgi:ZIP family zinc transporter